MQGVKKINCVNWPNYKRKTSIIRKLRRVLMPMHRPTGCTLGYRDVTAASSVAEPSSKMAAPTHVHFSEWNGLPITYSLE